MLDSTSLLELVACPVCREALSSFKVCSSCGANFVHDGNTPSLLPIAAHRKVEIDFPSARSVVGDEFRAAFRYPVSSSSGDLPYHLDPRHAALIETLPKNARVLEIGCGGGQMRKYLAARNIEYVGIDISSTRVNAELQGHGGPDLLADAHFLPFKDHQFDIVYSAAVVEHLAFPHLVAQNVRRVLKPGGHFVGSVSFLEPWHDDSFFHMTPLGVFEFLTQAGLKAEFIWPGVGYSGFNALPLMGNKATSAARHLGSLLDLIYRSGNRLRNRLRGLPADIADDAIVGGATDWIASAP